MPRHQDVKPTLCSGLWRQSFIYINYRYKTSASDLPSGGLYLRGRIYSALKASERKIARWRQSYEFPLPLRLCYSFSWVSCTNTMPGYLPPSRPNHFLIELCTCIRLRRPLHEDTWQRSILESFKSHFRLGEPQLLDIQSLHDRDSTMHKPERRCIAKVGQQGSSEDLEFDTQSVCDGNSHMRKAETRSA